MTKSINFKYLKHNEIDSEKWNRCIDNALNCRIYAYDWHLDRTTIIWDALVWGDYEYVMPLPYRKKMGIRYLYQPRYSQQLGIFPSPPPLVEETFYRYIFTRFRYSDLNINSENLPIKNYDSFSFIPRKNYLLSLNNTYQILSASFSKNTKRNISKANKQAFSLIEGIRLEEYLEFKSKNLQPNIGEKDLGNLKSVIAYGRYKDFGKIYGAYSNTNELCAAVYFCRCKNRVIYFSAATSPKGKELGAMYFLMNSFIEQNAGKNLIIDFEGSMIEGVERFYKGLGAKPETYFQLKFNRLPLFLKWIKQK
jgi:hypothetical protein